MDWNWLSAKLTNIFYLFLTFTWLLKNCPWIITTMFSEIWNPCLFIEMCWKLLNTLKNWAIKKSTHFYSNVCILLGVSSVCISTLEVLEYFSPQEKSKSKIRFIFIMFKGEDLLRKAESALLKWRIFSHRFFNRSRTELNFEQWCCHLN